MTTEQMGSPVYIQVNRMILGYLAALSKTEPQMVMANLRDMATTALDRLNTGKKRSTWSYIKYPGTDFRIRAKCTREHNHMLREQHRVIAEKLFQDTTGAVKPKKRKEWAGSTYWSDFNAWAETSHPYANFSYGDHTIIEFDTVGRTSYIMMSQDEIDTVLVENFLLGPIEDDEDAE